MSYTYFFHLFFFFNDTATTEIYTLSLHDALPISILQVISRVVKLTSDTGLPPEQRVEAVAQLALEVRCEHLLGDRKSTRLNSSHLVISYAVFCLKKKTEYLTFSETID